MQEIASRREGPPTIVAMSTPALVELACSVYEDSYGSIGARVLRVLLVRGRSTAPELASATDLSPSAVLRTLVSLVTNRFARFWTRGPRTWYFADPIQVYSILWAGQLLTLFRDSADILETFVIDGPQHESTASAAIHELAARPRSILRTLHEYEFWPQEEVFEDLTSKQQRLIASDPGAMALSENSKKQQIAAGVQSELMRIQSPASPPGDERVLTIDTNRFLIVARRAELVELARRQIGDVSARVYEALLSLDERAVHNLRERRVPSNETSVSTKEIADALATSVDNVGEFLSSAFPALQARTATPPPQDSRDNSNNGDVSAKRAKLNGGTAQPIYSHSLRPQELVNKHLQLLASCSSFRFVQRVGDRMGGEWFVPLDRIIADLQREKFDAIVAQSFGNPAARLVRLIREVGKLDEKMLATRALLPALEIRHHMSVLAFFGFADIQELQRPNERSGSAGAPKRSVFLWYHRPSWAYSRMVDFLYSQMNELMTDLKALRQEHATLLSKLTREDVQSEMEQFLTAKEKLELAGLESSERDLLNKVLMIDRHIRIFRDY